MRYLPALIAPALLAALATVIDLARTLGAHPWWAQTVILIGLPIGVVLAAALSRTRLRRPVAVMLAALITGAALGTAHLGKTRFAASFAEDAVAGQMWYFGWIATCAMAAATVSTAFWPHRPGH